MLLINDNELLEGISGATGLILLRVFLFKYLSLNPHFELFISWMLVWYFRKIVNNIYTHKYKNKGHKLISIGF